MSSTLVRPAAVAGGFYTGDAAQLAAEVDAMIAAVTATGPAPKALVVPHAGHVYSGPIAASGYALLRDAARSIRRVVLLGPAHRVSVRSMALSGAGAFRTPLGDVPIDAELQAVATRCAGVVVDDRAHGPEHSLEVHLPFLQRILDPGWTLLPVVVGGASPAEVAALLDAVWGGSDTLVVISSDLSHYEPYEHAARHDRATAAAIVDGRLEDLDPHDACGAHPVRGLLEVARRRHLDVALLDLRSSGDTAGDRRQVVGYGSFAVGDLVTDSNPVPGADAADAGAADSAAGGVSDGDLALLLDIAEAAIGARVRGKRAPRPDAPAHLQRPGAAFVTVRRTSGDLLGCIGSLEARRPLAEDVAANALAAAFADPRFSGVTAADLADAELHVSVLTPTEPMDVRSRDELRAAVRPGIDGLLIESAGHRGTFLPSVWEQLGDVDTFLDHLWSKAGLRPGTWPHDLRVWRYGTVEAGRRFHVR